MPVIQIYPITPAHQGWVSERLHAAWGSTQVVSRGQIHDASQLPGFVAVLNGEICGLATYRVQAAACEVVTLNSWHTNQGVGTGLLEAVKRTALEAGCHRLWLITTNDNLRALEFYQKRGFRLVTIYPNALAESRKIKPEIPLIGLQGIPLRDEIELEIRLTGL